METENAKKNSVRKILLLILIFLWTSFLVYFAVMMMLAPLRKMEELKKEYGQVQTERPATERKEGSKTLTTKKVKEADRKDQIKDDVERRFLTESEYVNKLRIRAFLQSKIVMAETDSIYLTINLVDSTMNLEISGVVVHSATMKSFRASSILENGNEDIISSMLSTPLTIASDLATIKKEPVMIKMAPKDTTEYKPDIMPDTSLTEPVNYILEMTNGIRIYVYQDEHEKKIDRQTALKFDWDDRMKQVLDALKSIMVFKVPDYHPFIRIRVPRADAKIIYRAIPKYGQITVFM
jgi:hypothetical protein